MKYKELKNKSESELQRLLKADREKLRDLRFKVANKQLKDIRKIRGLKRGIARVLTALNSRKPKVENKKQPQESIRQIGGQKNKKTTKQDI